MATPSQRRSLPSGRHGIPRDIVVRDQRERMLEAMIRVASDKGYEATTVADVIEAAAVSRTTFYEMFKDKEDCFLASYDAVVDVFVHHVVSAYNNSDATWPERVHTALIALVEILAAEPAIARMAMVEVTGAGPAARQRYREALGRFTPFLDEGRAFSGYGMGLPMSTSRLAIGSAAALLFDEIRAGRATELGDILPDLVFAVLTPFIGPEGAAEEIEREAEQPRPWGGVRTA